MQMFTTRVRAIIVASVAALLFLATLLGWIDYVQIFPFLADATDVTANTFTAVATSLLVFFGTLWVLFFKSKKGSLFIFSGFVGIAFFPYVLLSDSVLRSLFLDLGTVSVSILASVVAWVVCYLLTLTANVLNGSLQFNIPLGQAGKAAQFIFSLVSSYLLFTFLFGTGMDLLPKILIAALFVFAYTYSCLFGLNLPGRQSVISSTAISLMMLTLTAIISIWPLNSVYATLVCVVVFYVLLNVALEMREKLAKTLWFEYGILFLLIVILVVTNARWGVQGPLI